MWFNPQRWRWIPHAMGEEGWGGGRWVKDAWLAVQFESFKCVRLAKQRAKWGNKRILGERSSSNATQWPSATKTFGNNVAQGSAVGFCEHKQQKQRRSIVHWRQFKSLCRNVQYSALRKLITISRCQKSVVHLCPSKFTFSSVFDPFTSVDEEICRSTKPPNIFPYFVPANETNNKYGMHAMAESSEHSYLLFPRQLFDFLFWCSQWTQG